MNRNQNAYLAAMGISEWQLKTQPSALEPVLDQKPQLDLDWDGLKQAVAACTACGLHGSRTQTVFGVGNREADLMIVGEAPGFYEDQQGEPFVGRAGQLLTAMLAAIKLPRQQVYIANILKCRPPNNRDPQPEEVSLCTPFLNRQIELIQPKLILAVGRIAAHYLLNKKTALTQLRGQIYRYGKNETPLIVTYHPAYLLRNPRDKAQAWQDWLLAKAQL
jgi:uracil-DNA glycosylase family 4